MILHSLLLLFSTRQSPDATIVDCLGGRHWASCDQPQEDALERGFKIVAAMPANKLRASIGKYMDPSIVENRIAYSNDPERLRVVLAERALDVGVVSHLRFRNSLSRLNGHWFGPSFGQTDHGFSFEPWVLRDGNLKLHVLGMWPIPMPAYRAVEEFDYLARA